MQREGEALLSKRDAFVAKRIDESLAEGENGVLFLGLAHRVDELLEGKFEVRHLIHSLPFGADPGAGSRRAGVATDVTKNEIRGNLLALRVAEAAGKDVGVRLLGWIRRT